MKFIHIADVNLGAQPDRGRIWSDVRAKEIYSTFHRVIEVCEEQKIELLLIAGNLFYTKPTEQDLKELDFQLRKIPNTKTVIIAGDQDYIDPGSAWETYTFESNTIVMPRDQAASVYFEDLNVCVSGYSYGHATYTGRILERMRPGIQYSAWTWRRHGTYAIFERTCREAGVPVCGTWTYAQASTYIEKSYGICRNPGATFLYRDWKARLYFRRGVNFR